MSSELSQRQLLDIAAELEVNVPIMNYRVVGDRVELFLYGGQVVSSIPPDAVYLEDLTKQYLYKFAANLDISGRSKMNKDQLIEAILSAAS